MSMQYKLSMDGQMDEAFERKRGEEASKTNSVAIIFGSD